MSTDPNTENNRPEGSRKFFFDINNFNDDFVEEVEEEIPPPPVFSEDELAAAKKDAFAQGKKEGLAEAAASRETHVSKLLETLTQNFSILFSAEEKRATLFEHEAVHLARAIFNKLFPALNKNSGLDEIQQIINKTLETQKEVPEIIIEVASDYQKDVQEQINIAVENTSGSGNCSIIGKENMGDSDCALLWKDGGAMRDITNLSQEINTYLEQTLAGKPRLLDNEENDQALENENLDTIKAQPEKQPGQEEPIKPLKTDTQQSPQGDEQ